MVRASLFHGGNQNILTCFTVNEKCGETKEKLWEFFLKCWASFVGSHVCWCASNSNSRRLQMQSAVWEHYQNHLPLQPQSARQMATLPNHHPAASLQFQVLADISASKWILLGHLPVKLLHFPMKMTTKVHPKQNYFDHLCVIVPSPIPQLFSVYS